MARTFWGRPFWEGEAERRTHAYSAEGGRREEARSAGGGRDAAAGAAREDGGQLEVEEGPDRSALPISQRGRGRREVGRRAPSWAERGERAAGEREGRGGRWSGPRAKKGRKRGFDLFSFSFSTLLEQNFQTFYL
jgi:hypothetical protein